MQDLMESHQAAYIRKHAELLECQNKIQALGAEVERLSILVGQDAHCRRVWARKDSEKYEET